MESCKKKTVIYFVKGKLTDQTFNQPLSGVDLTVDINGAGSSLDLKYTTLTTDANGEYSFEIERSRFTKLIIHGTKENYFDFTSQINISNMSVDEDNVVDLSTTAMAWVRLKFDNTGGSQNDNFEYVVIDGLKDCEDCCPNTRSFSGEGIHEFVCVNEGKTNYSIDWVHVGVKADFASVYTEAFDTTELLVEF